MVTRRAGWATVLVAVVSLSPSVVGQEWSPGADPPPVGNPRNETALAADRQDREVERFLSAYLAGRRPDPALRAKLHASLRKSSQAKRLADPEYRRFAESLTVADALNLYDEVVSRLTHLYPDADRSRPVRLFDLGREEFGRAVTDPSFPVGVVDAGFSDWLRAVPPPKSAADARRAVREVAREGSAKLGLKSPALVVLEFLAGACGGLDEFTAYLPPGKPADDFAAYGLTVRAGVVERVEPLSWAEHVRLKPGERVVGTVTGPRGHDLTIAGRLTPVRLPVPPPTVFGTDMLGVADSVGYLRLAAFRNETPADLDDALVSLIARGARAVVIDVRGNPGGQLAAAVHVAERFLPGGIVVTTQGRASEFAGRVFSSAGGLEAYTLPVVLLIDARTMSAAEAVAAAWKDHRRAVLVGTQTFGKGVIQSPLRLTAAGASRSGTLVLTVATMTGPNGKPLDGHGVWPDIAESDPDRQLEVAVRRAAELAAGMP